MHNAAPEFGPHRTALLLPLLEGGGATEARCASEGARSLAARVPVDWTTGGRCALAFHGAGTPIGSLRSKLYAPIRYIASLPQIFSRQLVTFPS